MKARQNPKVRLKYTITNKKRDIGYIQLVSYLGGDSKPHIEFYLDDDDRNKGIMSKELPKYLKQCKGYNDQLIAIVKDDNKASIKLLEKNGFIRITQIENNICYIIDLNLTPEIIIKTVKKIRESFPEKLY